MSTIYAPELLDALEGAARPWRGSVWRRVIGDVDPTRPNVRGARWNPPGAEALYFSLSEVGARAELAAVIERQSIPIRRPLRSFQFEVELSQVVDLRDERLASVGYATDLLIGDHWSLPTHVGGAANWLELAGLIVPSARHSDGNLVLYVNHLQSTDLLKMVEGDAR